jgi:hypothetical protein
VLDVLVVIDVELFVVVVVLVLDLLVGLVVA